MGIVNNIKDLRLKIDYLTQYIARIENSNDTEFLKHTKYNPLNYTLAQVLETTRQKQAAKANKLKGYNDSTKQRENNSLF